MPLLLSEGGEVARIAREGGWGRVVPVNDAPTTAAAIEALLEEREQAGCRSAMAESRERWTWSRDR